MTFIWEEMRGGRGGRAENLEGAADLIRFSAFSDIVSRLKNLN